jgi:glycosyltransferase involved in cell wall biosynthesis
MFHEKVPTMRVVHLITTLERGGAEAQLVMLLRHQVHDQGMEVHVRSLYGGMALAPALMAAGAASVERLSGDRLSPVAALRSLTRDLKRLRPGVLHTHLMKSNLLGGLAGRMAGVPAIVAHKHNDEEHMRRRPLALIHDLLSRMTDDAVIYVSHHVEGFFRERGPLPHPNGHVIHNGIDPGSYRRRRDMRAELGLGPDALLFGSVGRIAPQKGMDLLIRAFETVADTQSDAHLVIVGGPGLNAGHVALVEELAHGSRHAARIHLTGQTDTPMDAFDAIDVFVLASRWEGFGLVLVEAMMAGCRIIATRVSAISEVVRDGIDGHLVAPEDPAALAASMIDQAVAGRLAHHPNADRVSTFSVERMSTRIRALYDSLLEPRS